jgi:hypothetical protein
MFHLTWQLGKQFSLKLPVRVWGKISEMDALTRVGLSTSTRTIVIWLLMP